MIRINRFWLPLAGFLLLAVVFAIALKRAPNNSLANLPSVLIGKPAPEFTLPAVGDRDTQVSISQFRGNWTLLNVWATWCVECRVEHPLLLDLQREGKVTIVGLNYKDQDELALEWLRQLGNPYAANAADPEGRAAIDYGVYAAPETFLIDPQGVIRRKRIGALTREVWEKEFAPLIGGAS